MALASLIFIAIVVVYLVYTRDLQAIRARIASESQVVETRLGPIEFKATGSGPAVLAVHGAGGGYDQGFAMATAFGGDHYHWIAPSRFGYLRTPLPNDASTAAQAEAFADLLDQIGVDRVALLAMSGGAPPALMFATRFPERTSALVLVSSAPYTPLNAATQDLPVPIWAYQTLFGSDFPYWLLTKIARATLENIFDAGHHLTDALSPDEKVFLTTMVDTFQPVTSRIDGVRNEGAAIDPQARYAIESITAPTLVIHARDDGINPFAIGEYTAQHIPGAAFMALDTGGHLLLGNHAGVRDRVDAFLKSAIQTDEASH